MTPQQSYEHKVVPSSSGCFGIRISNVLFVCFMKLQALSQVGSLELHGHVQTCALIRGTGVWLEHRTQAARALGQSGILLICHGPLLRGHFGGP